MGVTQPRPPAAAYNPGMVATPVTLALDALGIAYTLHLHSGPLTSLEQAARERGLVAGQIVRSLLFRLGDGGFVMLLTAGPGKASWPKLRRHLGVSRLTTATPDEVRRVTGYEPRAVSPFGLPQPVRMLADLSLLAHGRLSLGAGLHNAGVILQRDDLLISLAPEIGDFAEPETPGGRPDSPPPLPDPGPRPASG